MHEQAPLTAPRAALPRTTGVAGLATVILLFGAQGFMQVGGGEPAFDAPAGTVAEFFEARDQGLFPIGAYLTVLGLVAFLWFLGGVYALLRDHEWPRPWRATIALVSGVAFVASVIAGGWQLAVFRVDEGLDPQLAARAVWTTPVWFVPYTLLWLWVMALSVLLLRRWIPRRE